jgi:hypothetical protein
MDHYAELAKAIVLWDLVQREGLRHQQHAADDRLRRLANDLRAQGYTVDWKADEDDVS